MGGRAVMKRVVTMVVSGKGSLWDSLRTRFTNCQSDRKLSLHKVVLSVNPGKEIYLRLSM